LYVVVHNCSIEDLVSASGQILQEELSTFVAEREQENRPLPSYVTDEFDAYLK
jgi:hypothetical protein